jgi:hypothetical protein
VLHSYTYHASIYQLIRDSSRDPSAALYMTDNQAGIGAMYKALPGQERSLLLQPSGSGSVGGMAIDFARTQLFFAHDRVFRANLNGMLFDIVLCCVVLCVVSCFDASDGCFRHRSRRNLSVGNGNWLLLFTVNFGKNGTC